MTRGERREFLRQYGTANPHAMRAEIERQNTARGIPMKLTRQVPQRRHTDRTPLVTKLGLTILILLFSAVSLEVLARWEHRANRPQRTEFERTHGYAETWPCLKWHKCLHVVPDTTIGHPPFGDAHPGDSVYGTGSAGSPLTTRHVPQ